MKDYHQNQIKKEKRSFFWPIVFLLSSIVFLVVLMIAFFFFFIPKKKDVFNSNANNTTKKDVGNSFLTLWKSRRGREQIYVKTRGKILKSTQYLVSSSLMLWERREQICVEAWDEISTLALVLQRDLKLLLRIDSGRPFWERRFPLPLLSCCFFSSVWPLSVVTQICFRGMFSRFVAVVSLIVLFLPEEGFNNLSNSEGFNGSVFWNDWDRFTSEIWPVIDYYLPWRGILLIWPVIEYYYFPLGGILSWIFF